MNKQERIDKAREHYITRARRRPKQVFNSATKTWSKIKRD